VSPVLVALVLGLGGGGHEGVGLAPAGALVPDTVPAYRIVEEETLVAVITLRSGVAGRFAHDHLIYAPRYQAELTLDPEDPPGSSLRLTIRSEELVVDDGRWQAEVQDRLQELGILDGPFQDTDAGEREDIKEAVVSRGQLYAEAYPEILLRTGDIRSRDDPEFPWEVEVHLTVRDEENVAWAPVRLEQDGNRVRLEGHTAYRFTHFGIEPYRAFLGMVRTRDPFYLYLRLVAEPTEDP